MKLSQNPWKKWGFQGNPFETTALSPNSKQLPLTKAFVGRSLDAPESKKLIDVISNPGGGRVVVEGDIGVGKTTLVNYHRYLWENDSDDLILTPIREISVYQKWEAKHFLMDMIGHISNKLLLLIGYHKLKKNKLFDKVRFLHEIFYHDNVDIQGSLFGIGVAYNKSKQVSIPNMTESQLISYLMDMVNEIKKIGYKGIFLHFDNLELLIQNEIKKCQNFFEEIRDILQLPDIYYIFVAKSGFFSQVISPSERVSSIMGWPIYVEPLTCQEVLDAINIRYKLLSNNGKYIKPVDEEFVSMLYQFYGGKIRFIMDTLARVILHKPLAVTLSCKKAEKTLSDMIKEKINFLTSKEREILFEAVNMRMFNNSDLSNKLKIKTSNISRALTKFQQKNLIYFVKQKGKKIYYNCLEELKILAERKAPIQSKKKQRQEKIIYYMKNNGILSSARCSQIMKVSEPTARRDLFELLQQNRVVKIAQGRKIYYDIK
ncbi:DeoR family transcriptional regulator [Candidatus Uabimicrobium sp. HlEnr_7]|uniref:DeoR family transcriptional regulator n=1 Tax=Candidatus Uabimicrobium helgolandensis TaxID=3095367 RepID=UPI0035561F94